MTYATDPTLQAPQRRLRVNTRQHVAAFLAFVMSFMAVPGFARAPKAANPEAVKAKVEKLGVGEHVMVKRTEGPKLRGHITGIEQEGFKLKQDKTQAEILIPYNDVLQVKKNPGAITWMLLGAALVVIIIVANS